MALVTAGGATVFKSFTFIAGNLACGAPLVRLFNCRMARPVLERLPILSRRITSGSVATALYSSGNTAVAIPDNNLTGVDIPITINDAGSILDVNVTVRLNHTWDGDLQLTLIGPDNTSVL